jgi:2',3'-cyclic-nucleotide 2'-phosphodiesterase (5'-nucleotidase family)
VQAGSKASAVGRVDMLFDPANNQVRDATAKLVDLLDEPAAKDRNAKVEEICARLAAQSSDELKQVVGELTGPIRGGKGPFSTIAGNWIADMLRARTGADVAFHNRGGTRAEIEAGPVTRRQVFEILPFDNDVVTVTLTGAQLESCVRGSVEGTTHTGLDYSGLRAFVRVTTNGAKTALELDHIEVGGKPLEHDGKYRVATNSFLAGGGDGFDDLAKAPERVEDPILLRDMAVEEFQRTGQLTPPSDARIVDVAANKP